MAQLPDDEVQRLFEEIDRTGRIYARAKARAKSLEKLLGVVEARLMKIIQATGIGAVAVQKRDARTLPQYEMAIKEWEDALEAEVNAQTTNENAIRAWESWRTLCANERNFTR